VSGPTKVTYDDMKGINKSNMVIVTPNGLLVEAKTKSHIVGNQKINSPGVSMQMPMDFSRDSKVTAIN
jgi:hypothetical protein